MYLYCFLFFQIEPWKTLILFFFCSNIRSCSLEKTTFGSPWINPAVETGARETGRQSCQTLSESCRTAGSTGWKLWTYSCSSRKNPTFGITTRVKVSNIKVPLCLFLFLLLWLLCTGRMWMMLRFSGKSWLPFRGWWTSWPVPKKWKGMFSNLALMNYKWSTKPSRIKITRYWI